MSSESALPTAEDALLVEKALYGGDGLARTGAGQAVSVPFALPGELVRPGPPLTVVEASSERTAPRCVHFGVCGGCQYQMAAYPAQLAMKIAILDDTLEAAGVQAHLAVEACASPEPYGYRNRIRLRVRRADGVWRVGYNLRGSDAFLPVTMCPISAPLLWRTAEAFLAIANATPDAAPWLEGAGELELFCDAEETRLQLTLRCASRPAKRGPAAAFGRAMEALAARCPQLVGAGVVRVDPRSGQQLDTLETWKTAGLLYDVAGEPYWITRGGFFQVNRFLLPTLVEQVCAGRQGELAWDLFAGVGLFSRVLATTFGAVTAVEANPVACADLRRALAKLGPQHQAVEATTISFLRRAVLQRERPDLVVLDPPRAGAGEDVCRLLLQLRPRQIVYLSCDPTTLARDLAWLCNSQYCLETLQMIDLFPQTYHLETLAVLRRT